MDFDTEVYKHIELLLGSIGFIIALFFCTFLLVTRKQRAEANLFLAMYLLAFSLRIGKSLFYNYFPIDPVVRNVFLGMLLAIGPSLWFYTSLLYKRRTIDKNSKFYIHYIPFLTFIALCWVIPNDERQISRVFFMGLLFHIVFYGVYTIYWLIRNHIKSSQKLTQTYNWLMYLSILTVAMAFIQIMVFLRLVPYLSTAFLFSVIVLFLSVWALKNPFLFRIEQEKYSQSSLSPEKALQLLDQLNDLMKNEKLYLDPNLTLSKLSVRLGITSKQLSQVINQTKNQNYSLYVANYRVEEAKRLLRKEDYKHYKISAIAYESGFNSISSFNNAFKRLTQITALEYRKSLTTK